MLNFSVKTAALLGFILIGGINAQAAAPTEFRMLLLGNGNALNYPSYPSYPEAAFQSSVLSELPILANTAAELNYASYPHYRWFS